MKQIRFSEIEGFCVGHEQDIDAVTGCTDIICPKGGVSAVDIRGGGPATRETPLMDSDKNTHRIHSVVFSGGSAFGLAASQGVMECLEENNIGYKVRTGIVPLVSGACIFDLAIGKNDVRPDSEMGYRAAERALHQYEISKAGNNDTRLDLDSEKQGNVGAGMGATVGKLGGPAQMMKSGLGTYAVEHEGIKVGAIAVVNALGDIIDDGNIVAGMLKPDYKIGSNVEPDDIFASTFDSLLDKIKASNMFEFRRENTTLVCVVTNCDVTTQEAQKLAQMASNGMPRVIFPVNTSADGDAVFCMNAGDKKANIDVLGMIAADVVKNAIIRGVKETEGINDIPSYRDISR